MEYLLRIIRDKGFKGWNQFIRNNPVDLNFSKLRIKNFSFDGCNLNGANFQECKMESVSFKNSDLSNSDFKDSLLIDVTFGNLMQEPWASRFNRASSKAVALGEGSANLSKASFISSQIQNCSFQGALLSESIFDEAKITNCDFEKAFLFRSSFYDSELTGTSFKHSDLSESKFIASTLTKVDLSNSRIYGISVWDSTFDSLSHQENLIINSVSDSEITVDSIEIAQFIYLIINNSKIRNVIDTLTSKVVLILGRFQDDRKEILNSIKIKLREMNYLPILFDFEKPASRDYIETISTLAHLSRFIIADFSDAKIVLEEVPHVVRNLSVPVQPIINSSQKVPVTLKNLQKFPWVLETFEYSNYFDIETGISDKIIESLEKKYIEYLKKK